VFVVASARDDINPTEILFEFEGVRRDTPQSRKEGKVTPTISSSGTGVSRVGFNCEDEWFIETPVCGALDTECGGKKMSHQTVDSGHIFPVNKSAEATWWNGGQIASTITTRSADQDMPDKANFQAVLQPIAFPSTLSGTQCASAENIAPSMGAKNPMAVVAPTLTASNDPSRSPQSTEVTNQVAAIHAVSMAVRRLTPVECERLQGFPDNYSNIPWRKADESPDGPRYKALGNSWAVPVVAWIGKRIQDQLQ
jgi:DNA (cytosine-5)-methyltransferase 1